MNTAERTSRRPWCVTANRGTNNVSVVDVVSASGVATVPVGTNPAVVVLQ